MHFQTPKAFEERLQDCTVFLKKMLKYTRYTVPDEQVDVKATGISFLIDTSGIRHAYLFKAFKTSSLLSSNWP